MASFGDYDDFIDYDSILSFDTPRVAYDTDLPEPGINIDYDYDVDNAGVPYRTKFAESSPDFLDQIITAGKKSIPDLLKKYLLDDNGNFSGLAKGAAAGIGGAALLPLLQKLFDSQNDAPAANQYVSPFSGVTAAPAQQPKFAELPSQAQSYKSMMGMKDGGPVHMQSGDFVFSKKALDKAGGIEGLMQRGYPAQEIVGPGTGTSDSIPATIDGVEPARVANGEALIRGGAKMKGLASLHKQMRRA